jgi:hypothetical protein
MRLCRGCYSLISPDWTLILRTIYTQSRGGGPRPMPPVSWMPWINFALIVAGALIALVKALLKSKS